MPNNDTPQGVDCSSLEGLYEAALILLTNAHKVAAWTNSDEQTDVELGGKMTPSIRKLVESISKISKLATMSSPGAVQPDGVTTKVNSLGVLSVVTATSNSIGLVKPDAKTITINKNGELSVNASAGLRRGGIAAYYNVTFGGSDGRRPIFWGETEADENYVLCDGGSDGAGGIVPDLRGRMILGASDDRPAGSIGGSRTHKHSLSGTVGATTLTESQLAQHRHQFQSGDNERGNGAHATEGNYAWLAYTYFTGGSQPHTHSLAADTGPTGSMPPYYALALIMRIA